MAPREGNKATSAAIIDNDGEYDDNNVDGSNPNLDTATTTQVYYPKNAAPYMICTSQDAFVNPTNNDTNNSSSAMLTPEEINQQLNLDLGLPFLKRQNFGKLLWTIQFLDTLCVSWWEELFFTVWKSMIPLSWKRALTFASWKYFYLPFHKYLLGRQTGIHKSQSYEYHALTTLIWWGRFFPISPRRMRFSLSQLHVCSPNVVPRKSIQHVEERIIVKDVPAKQAKHCTVKGMYLNKPDCDSTIFWLYGGAYLAGDTEGNAAAADWVANAAGVNVFLPEFRLAPDADLDEVLWDVVLAYQWLLSNCKDPSKIIVLGISSGGAIAVKLMQMIAAHQRQQQDNDEPKILPEFVGRLLFDKTTQMPMAAALFAPYVDYTEPKRGSFLHYARHDLIVNESVQDYGLPYLNGFIPGGKRREYSPVYGSMDDLPPMVVTVSEHECVYDMTMELVNKCRAAGVPVTLGVWKYMCHVFSFFWAFCPEGQQSMKFMCDWIKEQVEQ